MDIRLKVGDRVRFRQSAIENEDLSDERVAQLPRIIEDLEEGMKRMSEDEAQFQMHHLERFREELVWIQIVRSTNTYRVSQTRTWMVVTEDENGQSEEIQQQDVLLEGVTIVFYTREDFSSDWFEIVE